MNDGAKNIKQAKYPEAASGYKEVYNRHRRRPQDPLFLDDLKELIDFSTNFDSDDRIVSVPNPLNDPNSNNDDHTCHQSVDSKNVYKGPLFGLKSHPGFLYAPQAISKSLQRHIAFQAVTEFCEPPNATNIDLIPPKIGKEIDNRTLIQKNILEDRNNNNHKDNVDMVTEEERIIWNIWKKKWNFSSPDNEKSTQKESSPELQSKPKKKYYRSFDKLSWSTLGYQYDWTLRAYTEQKKSPIPLSLHNLGRIFARLESMCNNNHQHHHQRYNYTPQAAIVNYYSTKAVMGGHHDESELDHTQPVVSFSFGLPAVFLLGGSSKDAGDAVVPILVRPGDVMIMGGQSRLSYHGMARVLDKALLNRLPKVRIGKNLSSHINDNNKDEMTQGFQPVNDVFVKRKEGENHSQSNTGNGDDNSDNSFFSYYSCEERENIPSIDSLALDNFLLEYRLNINVRQVLPPGISRIPNSE